MGADTVRSRLRDSALERRRGGGVDRLAGPFTSSLLLLHTFSLTSTELKDFFLCLKKIYYEKCRALVLHISGGGSHPSVRGGSV